MKNLIKKIKVFMSEQDGQGMVEYGLIIALVAIVVIGAIVLLGGNISGLFTKAASALAASPAPSP